ncbi:hypothetical protein HWV62_37181 [Athelia sp. TMB]|nr:hypothetical protein HWV62_37181 [Athelia sp. TMB]
MPSSSSMIGAVMKRRRKIGPDAQAVGLATTEPTLGSDSERSSLNRPSLTTIEDEATITNTIPKANWLSRFRPTFKTTRSGHVINVGRDYNATFNTYNDGTSSEVKAVADTNTRVKGIQNDQKSDRIKTWMKAPDTSINYNAAQKLHQGDIGSWFTSCHEFITWKQQGSVLWLHGKQGYSSLAIKEVEAECVGAICYAYFFFDGRDSSELSRHESLIRSLIMQFSAQCDGIPLALDELYTVKCRNGFDQPSIASLEKTLRLIIGSLRSAYIIVDALDECGELHELLQWISNITSGSETSSQLHFMVISRPEPDIKRGLESLKNLTTVSVADRRAADEIRRYIDTRLSKDSKWSEDINQTIREGLVGGADGMLRWVALQYDDLMRCVSRRELEDQLKSLPRGLNETYEKILARSSRPDDLKRFLQLLACAWRPLTVEEIAEAVVVTSSPNDLDDVPACDFSRRYGNSDDVLNTCYGLVTEVKGFVKLAHFSVKEFISSDEIKNGAARFFYTNESLSHSASARICLVYLLQFDKPESVTEDDIESLPLTEYAARWFDFHVRSTQAVDTEPNQQLLQRLFGSVPNYALTNWAQLRDTYIAFDGRIDLGKVVELANGSAPLYYASILGLTQVVPHLIYQGADPNVPSGPEGTALQGAAYHGQFEVSKLLLRLGADININVGKHGTVLQAAPWAGSAEIVKLLLEKGADPNIGGGQYGSTLLAALCAKSAEIVALLLENGADLNVGEGQYESALHVASRLGSAEIITLLLEKGADPNIGGGEFGSALQAASWAGSAEIVTLLLEKGADPNIRGGPYGCALQGASFHGSAEIVTLLLEKGADPNSGGGEYGCALQAASAMESAKIVTLLLEKGADPNSGGGEFGSALQAASWAGSAEIVTLLLDRGANVNAEGGQYGTALQAASAVRSAETVKVLLEWNADVNIVGGRYGTALQAASYSGDDEIVKLLLQNGADVNAEGGKHGTAIRAAREDNWQQGKTEAEVDVIVTLLKEHGAVETDTASQ